jgi:hypothetical protein
MIEKCAQVRALKLAFGISGLVSDVEMDEDVRDSRTVETTLEMADVSAKKAGQAVIMDLGSVQKLPDSSEKPAQNSEKPAEIDSKPAKSETQNARYISDDDFFTVINKIGRHSPEAKKWALDLMGGKEVSQIDQPARQKIVAEITRVAQAKGIAL